MAFLDILSDMRFQHFVLQGVQHVNTSRESKKQTELTKLKHETERQLLLDLKAEVTQMHDEIKAGSTIEIEGTAVETGKKAVYSQYAPDMDVSIGCVPCTRAHLATVSAAMQEASTAKQADQQTSAVAAAREEVVALLEYDLTPEKLSATPEIDREVLSKYADKMVHMRDELQGPVPETTIAAASLKEALRFAREDGIDHPEVQIRVQRTEEVINALERVKLAPEKLRGLSPEQKQAAKEALPELRRARQDLLNKTKTADDLEEVTARIALIDQSLNPAPDANKVQALAKEARQLNTEFRRDVLNAWREHKEGNDQHATNTHT